MHLEIKLCAMTLFRVFLDRVSAYVLLEVEKQIESLIDLESGVNMNSSANQDTDVRVEAPVSCQSMNNASIQNEITETAFPKVQIEKNESQSPDSEAVNNYHHWANTQTLNQPVVFYCDRLHNNIQNSMYEHESINISPTMNNSQCATSDQPPYYDIKQQSVNNRKSKKRFFTAQQSDQAGELAKADPLTAREHIHLTIFNCKTFVNVVLCSINW